MSDRGKESDKIWLKPEIQENQKCVLLVALTKEYFKKE
jgi:hypothetical protein